MQTMNLKELLRNIEFDYKIVKDEDDKNAIQLIDETGVNLGHIEDDVFYNVIDIIDRTEQYWKDYVIDDEKERYGLSEDATWEDVYHNAIKNDSLNSDILKSLIYPETVEIEEFSRNQNKVIEQNPKEQATNYVLEKLKAAGIEIVRDKDEFNRILEREQYLQKMAGTLTTEEQKRYFTFNDEETKRFKQQVDEWQADKSNVAKLITVGKIPPVMKVLGLPDNPIEIQHSTLAKAMRPMPQGYPNEAQGHALTLDDIYSIPEQLADPVMVFKSRTRNDSYVFFTERKDGNNHSILIPMAVNKHKGKIVINEITSMYGKDNESDFVKKNIDEDNLIYVDKKRSTEWERSSHVQFVTQRLSNSNAYDLNILTKERLVNFISANSQEKKTVQKMAVAYSEPENVESLFVSKNEANLNSEIDKLTEKDVNIWNDYLSISSETPFIYKQFGLDDYPVNMYKQKLAKALFLEKEKFGERLTHGHKGEFTREDVKKVFKDIGNPRYIFNSKKDLNNPDNFYLIGVYDEMDEQENPMMLSLHFDRNRKQVEANWVTSVYGKDKETLLNDWVRKGYLIYENDIVMEKASEEVVALYMRVSNLQKPYENNIKRKSDYVNDMDLMFAKQNENVYGFAYEGKIYLNPDFLTSNVAVHEYTHLWDEYTRRTNKELWQKGMDIFKNTRFFNEVKSDPNYADIADDDNLVLSEVHARICGDMAQKVLERIAKEDGEITKDRAIDWDAEITNYFCSEFGFKKPELVLDMETYKEFLATPMKDLMNGKNISVKITNPIIQKSPEGNTMNHDEKLLYEDLLSLASSDDVELPSFTRVKIYDPKEFGLEDNGSLHVLAEYHGEENEDGIFNTLLMENMEFNGQKIDWNPISIEQNGTIDQYLERMAEHYKSYQKKLEELDINKIMKETSEQTVKNIFGNEIKNEQDFLKIYNRNNFEQEPDTPQQVANDILYVIESDDKKLFEKDGKFVIRANDENPKDDVLLSNNDLLENVINRMGHWNEEKQLSEDETARLERLHWYENGMRFPDEERVNGISTSYAQCFDLLKSHFPEITKEESELIFDAMENQNYVVYAGKYGVFVEDYTDVNGMELNQVDLPTLAEYALGDASLSKEQQDILWNLVPNVNHKNMEEENMVSKQLDTIDTERMDELAQKAYKKYQYEWLSEHDISLEDITDEMDATLNDYMEETNGERLDASEQLREVIDNGINGEMFASLDEFKTNEFLDPKSVELGHLLEGHDKDEYLSHIQEYAKSLGVEIDDPIKELEPVTVTKESALDFFAKLSEEKKENIFASLKSINALPLDVYTHGDESYLVSKTQSGTFTSHLITDSGLEWGHYDISTKWQAQKQTMQRVAGTTFDNIDLVEVELVKELQKNISDITFEKTADFIESSKKNLEIVGNILKNDDNIFVENKEAGKISIEKGNVGKSGNGLQHIIEQRFEKDGRSVDEISAMLSLVVTAASEGKISRDVKIFQNEKDIGTLDIEKNGIIAFVSKSRDGTDEKFVITGFDDSKNKRQAEDAMKTVIAEHSYTPEFAIVKEQVGATLVSAYRIHQKELERNKEILQSTDNKNVASQIEKKIKKLEDTIKFYDESELPLITTEQKTKTRNNDVFSKAIWDREDIKFAIANNPESKIDESQVTDKQIDDVISNLNTERLEEAMIETGWTYIDQAVSETIEINREQDHRLDNIYIADKDRKVGLKFVPELQINDETGEKDIPQITVTSENTITGTRTTDANFKENVSKDVFLKSPFIEKFVEKTAEKYGITKDKINYISKEDFEAIAEDRKTIKPLKDQKPLERWMRMTQDVMFKKGIEDNVENTDKILSIAKNILKSFSATEKEQCKLNLSLDSKYKSEKEALAHALGSGYTHDISENMKRNKIRAKNRDDEGISR